MHHVEVGIWRGFGDFAAERGRDFSSRPIGLPLDFQKPSFTRLQINCATDHAHRERIRLFTKRKVCDWHISHWASRSVPWEGVDSPVIGGHLPIWTKNLRHRGDGVESKAARQWPKYLRPPPELGH